MIMQNILKDYTIIISIIQLPSMKRLLTNAALKEQTPEKNNKIWLF